MWREKKKQKKGERALNEGGRGGATRLTKKWEGSYTVRKGTSKKHAGEGGRFLLHSNKKGKLST